MDRLLPAPLLAALLLVPRPVLAVDFGEEKEPNQAELVAGIHRDIEKVNQSIDVTRELIDRARNRPYLPDLMFRMAELYVEKSRLVFFLALEKAGQGSKVASSPEARLLKEKAISIYDQILLEFPRFAGGDRVLFFRAHEFRELANYDQMRRTYQRLIDTYPGSSFRHEARLVLGDHHFDGGELEAAEEHYRRILSEPETFAHQTARYKMAWIRINQEKLKEAKDLLLAIVKSAMDSSGAGGVDEAKLVSIRREALSDLVYVYTEVEKPEGALEYFEPLCTSKPEYLRVLGRLANRLYVQEKWLPAAKVYRRLVALSGDAEQNAEHVTRIFAAAQEAKNLTGADKDVSALARAMERYLSDWRFSQQERANVEHDFEIMGRDVATRLQAEAQAAGNKGNLAVAADAYAAYLRAFPDSPHRADMMLNEAESLFGAGRFLEAATVHESFATLSSTDEDRKEAMFSAIVSYSAALKDVEQMSRYEVMLTREGLKGTGQGFVDSFPGDTRVANVRFNIAKLNYDQGHFIDAADLFSAFAEAYPGHVDAPAAGHLALDALDKLEDFEKLIATGRRFIESTALDLAFRNEVQEIVKNASYKLVRDVAVAAGTRAGASEDEVDAELLAYAQKHGGTKLGEVALLSAFSVYQEKGNLSLMEKAAERFAADYPQSPKNQDILLAKAKTYMNVGRFDRAAGIMDDVARSSPPGNMMAIDLGVRSARLFAALGEHRRAIDSWLAVAPKLAREERVEAVAAVMDALLTLEDWRGLERAVEQVRKIDRGALKGPEVALRLGLAAMKQGRAAEARQQLNVAVKGGEEEAAAEAAYRLLELDLEEFQSVRFEPGKDPGEVVVDKLDRIDKMEGALFDIFDYGDPEWSIAALLRMGQANDSLAEFLENVPAPPGSNAVQVAQFKSSIQQQADAIRGKARETYAACTLKAYELDAFNRYLKGCLANGRLPPPDRLPGRVHLGPAMKSQLKGFEDRLAAVPDDQEALLGLANVYLKAGDMRMARMISGGALEKNDANGAARNIVGLATLLLGDPGTAIYDLQQAAMSGSVRDPVVNLATLYWLYGDHERAKAELKKVADIRQVDFASPGVHPKALQMARELGLR
jgi:tetratricopeptide (TPR) repeat protein